MADTKNGQIAIARGWTLKKSKASKRAPKQKLTGNTMTDYGTPF